MKRTANIVFLGIVLLMLFAVPIRTALQWQAGVSYYEQRTLAPLPQATRSTIWSGGYFTDLETALSDHLTGREHILKANTAMNLALGRPKVNGLVVNTDKLVSCYGYTRWDLGYLTGQAATAAQSYAALNRLVKSYGGYFCYLGVPLQSTYFADHYPSYMESRLWHTTAIREAFSAAMAEQGVPFINLYAAYQEQGMPESYYYATDHHYTYEGAFAAYEILMDRIRADTNLGLAALGRPDFTWLTLPNPFLGSSNRKLYGLWPNDDRAEIAVPKADIPLTRTDNGGGVESRVFELPERESQTVTYSVYMGGDIAETVLSTDRPELPSILIYGDSFTNPLETLLWTNFNETYCLDFRYYTKKTLEEYIAEYRPDVVLCVRDEIHYLSADGNGTT